MRTAWLATSEHARHAERTLLYLVQSQTPLTCAVHSLDWYMVAQHGLKGTSRPSHYHILHNDFGTPTELQRLTFELCHLYARATKIVSRPAPVYYAHRAAFLAQYV